MGVKVNLPRRRFFKLRGGNVEVAAGLLLVTLLEANQANAAELVAPTDSVDAAPVHAGTEDSDAVGHLANVDPAAIHTMSIDQLVALLDADTLAKLGLGKGFIKHLQDDPHAAIRQLEAAFRKKLAVAALHDGKIIAAGDASHVDRDSAHGDHDTALAGGGLSPLLILGGLAVVGGGIALAASGGGSDKGASTPANTAPVAVNDAVATAEDTAVTFDPRTNDSDANGDTLTITQINGTAISSTAPVAITGGVVSLNANGTLTFTPTANFNGTPSFTYLISDGKGGTTTATVNLTVTAVNDAPVAVADTATTAEDTPVTINVLANDTDVDGNKLTVTQVNGTAITTNSVAVTGGVVALNAAGNLVFTPNANYNGTPSFTYTVSDGAGGTATSTVNLTVTAVNDAPVAVADAVTTLEDTPVTINVLANDTDVDGDKLAVTQVNGAAITLTNSVAVTGGVVTLNAAGNLVFTPTGNYNGAPSFSYTVSDGKGGTATSTVNLTVTAVNDAPVAVADAIAAVEDKPVTFDVRTNDGDVDGDKLTVTQINGAAITATTPVAITGGVISLNAAGTLTFTPNADYNGTPSFTYTISDGNGGTSTATATLTVAAVNDAPVALADTATTLEDTPVIIDVLANDTDVDADTGAETQAVVAVNGTAITLTNSVAVTGGVVTLNAAGNLVFTPNPNYNGTPSFTYTMADSAGLTSTATVNLTVTAVNDVPVAVADIVTTLEDTPVTINVLANDTDVDGDKLVVTQVNGTAITLTSSVAVAGGVVTLNAAGNLVFTPSANFNGTPSFAYTISDGKGGAATSTVSLTVTPVNDAPVNAVPGAVTVGQNASVLVAGIAISDIDSTALTTTLTVGHGTLAVGVLPGGATITGGGTGTVTLTGTQAQINASLAAVTFTGTTGFSGTDTLTIRTSDGTLTDIDTVTLTIARLQAGIVSDGYIAGGTVFLDVNGNGKFDAGEPTTTTDANGHYAFSSNLTGAVVAYGGINADTGLKNLITMTAPVGSGVINPLTTVIQSLVAAGMSVAQANAEVVAAFGLPAGTDLTNLDILSPNTDPALQLAAQKAASAIAAVLTIAGENASGASAADVQAAVMAKIGAMVDAAAHGGAAFDIHSAAALGSLFSGISGLSASAAAQAAVAAASAVGAIESATSLSGLVDAVRETLTPGADLPPAAGDDHATVASGSSVTIDVLANDKDPEGSLLTITKINGLDPVNGSVTIANVGTVVVNADGTLSFTPAAGVVGAQTFTYTVADAAGHDATAVVSVDVSAPVGTPNVAPVAVADAVSTTEDTPVTFDVRTNDSDANGDTLSVTAINGTAITATTPVVVAGGTISLNASGTLTFTPNADYNGNPTFTYTVSDGHGGTATATTSLTVLAANDAPVATPDAFTTAEDTPITFDVRANDSDVDGDTLTVTAINGSTITTTSPITITGGVISLNANGTLTFTPTADYNGNPTFTYTVSDGHGGTATAITSLTVTPVDDVPVTPGNTAPVAVADAFTTAEDTPITFDVRANDSDADGDTLTVTEINGKPITLNLSVAVAGGVVSLNPNGSLTFSPSADYNGSPTFTYTVSDGHGGTATATTSLTVTPVDDTPTAPGNVAPVAVADVGFAAANTAFTIDVRANDTDANGDTLTVTMINGTAIDATHPVTIDAGTISLLADGQLQLTPRVGYVGDTTFSYTVSDGHGGTATADTTLHVEPTGAVLAITADIFAETLAKGDYLEAHGVTTLDVVGDNLTIDQSQASTLIADGLHFAASDHVTMTSEGTHLGTTLKSLESLNVSSIAVGAGVSSLVVEAGEGGLGGLSASGLPQFDVAQSDASLDVTLNVAAGSLGTTDLSTLAGSLRDAGIDHIGVDGNGAASLSLAQASALSGAGIDFTTAADVTLDVNASDVAGLSTASLAALHIDHIDVTENAVTISDAEASALVGAGIDFAASDTVTVEASGTHLGTSLKSLESLNVSSIAVGADVHTLVVEAGEGGLGGLSASGLPQFDVAQSDASLDVTLNIAAGSLGTTDLSTLASSLREAGIDHIGVDGNGAASLSLAQASALSGAGLDFAAAADITLNVNAADVAGLSATTLGALHIDHIDVIGNSVTISDVEASALVDAGIDFASSDSVTVEAAGTHLGTTLKGLENLHVSSIAVAAGVSTLVVEAGEGGLAGLSASGLPQFDVAQSDASLDVTLNVAGGALDASLDLANLAVSLSDAGIDHIGVDGNGSIALSLAQASALGSAGLDFATAADVTVTLSAAEVAGLNVTSLAALHIDHLDVTGDAVTITDAQASALVTAGVDFAEGDNVTLTTEGTHLGTTLKGLESLHISQVNMVGATGSLIVDAGTTDLGSLASGALPHFTSSLDVTLDVASGSLSSGLDLHDAALSFASAGIDHIGVSGTGDLSISLAQAEGLSGTGIDFDQAATVTIAMTAAEVTSFDPHAVAGLNIDYIDVTDDAVSISDAQATSLIEAGLQFHAADNVTVEATGTHLSTSLKDLHDLHVDSIAVAAGVTSLHVDAGDLTGIDASDLPQFDVAQTNAALDVTLRVDSSEVAEIARLAAALKDAGIDHIALNDQVSSLDASDQASLTAITAATGITFTYEDFAHLQTGTVSSFAVASDASTLSDVFASYEVFDDQGHGGHYQFVDGAASSLAESGMLRAYTADVLVVDGTASGDHLLTTLKDIGNLGIDEVKLADQAGKPVYIDLGITNDADATTDIKTLFHNLELAVASDGTDKIFTGAEKVALVVDADTATALSHVDGAMDALAHMGFTEIDVLAAPGGTEAPAFVTSMEVKVIGQEDPLYDHLKHGN